MPKDPSKLSDVYDFGQGVDDAKTPSIDVTDFNYGDGGGPGMNAGSGIQHASPINANDYQGYIKAGVFDYQDINTLRGEGQGAWSKLGNFAARTVAKVGTGILDGIGYTGALLTEWGDDRDYSNGLTELARTLNNDLNESLPIYRTTDKTWGFGDLGWYLENAEGIISSLASFAVEGAGLAKLISGAGKVSRLGELSELISGSKKAGQFGERVLTSGALAYLEGAQFGNEVFKEVYKAQLDKGVRQGMSPDEAAENAKHIAAESASTSVQLNTMLNTGMNMWSVLPFFNHETRAVERTVKQKLFQQAGEKVDDWARRVGGYTADTFKKTLFKSQGLGAAIREGALEGAEEVTNQFAERTGREEGLKGETHGIFEQLGQLSKYFDRTMDSEGALNFVMGAIAGPMTNSVITHLPLHTVQTGYTQNENGEFLDARGNVVADEIKAAKTYASGSRLMDITGLSSGKFMTSRAKNAFQNTQYFNNLQEAIQEDVTFFKNKHQQIKIASDAGDYIKSEGLKRELFDVHSRRAVQLGFADELKQTYQEIAGLDNSKEEKSVLEPQIEELVQKIEEAKSSNQDTTELEQQLSELQTIYYNTPAQTEAGRSGFTASLNDNSFKDKALEAIKDLDELQKIHDRVQKKYEQDNEMLRTTDGKLAQHLTDFIFNRCAILHSLGKAKKEYETRIQELQSQAQQLGGLTGTSLNNHFNEALTYSQLHSRYAGRHAILVEEDKILREAVTNPSSANTSAAMEVLERYGAIGVTSDDIIPAITKTRDQLKIISDNINTRLKEANDNLLNSSGYAEWVKNNPNKSWEDYQKILANNYRITDEENQLNTWLQDTEDRIAAHSENLTEIETQRTMSRIVKATKDWWNKLAEEQISQQKAIIAAKERKTINEQTKKRLQLNRLESLRNQYLKELNQVQNSISTLSNELGKIGESIIEFHRTSNPNSNPESRVQKWNELNKQKELTEQKIQKLSARFNVLQSLYYEVENDIAVANGVEVEDDSTDIPADEDTEEVYDEETDDVVPDPQDIPETEVDIVVTESPVVEPMLNYEELLASHLQEVQDAMREYEQELKDGAEFSYDALITPVMFGWITQPEAAQLLQAFKDYQDTVSNEVQKIEAVQTEAQNVAATVLPEETELTDVEIVEDQLTSDSEETFTVSETEAANLPAPGDKAFVGKKRINAHSIAAGMDRKYTRQYNPVTRRYFKISTNELNSSTNPAVLNPNQLPAGTTVRLVVDTEYEGDVSVTDDTPEVNGKPQTEAFANYQDTKTSLVREDDYAISNVPIKLVSTDGSTVRYLPTVRWVMTRKDTTDGPEAYENVYDGSDAEGDVPSGNVQRQADALLTLRKKIVNQFNQGKEPIETIIEDKGPGVLFNNVDKDGNLVWAPAINSLPDTTLQMATWNGKEYVVGNQNAVASQDILNALPPGYRNQPVILLPMANGQYMADVIVPINQSLGDDDVALNSIIKAMELHLLQDKENSDVKLMADDVNGVGLDITTLNGLKSFINQYYTYTSADGVATKDKKSQYSLLQILPPLSGNFNTRIVIQNVSSLGRTETVGELKNGKFSPQFRKALKTLLSQRSKNVVFAKPERSIRGINEESLSPFREPIFNRNGKLTIKQHASYNEYIKTHYKTSTNGTNTVGITDRRGRAKAMYVYAVNPQIQFDTDPIMDMPDTIIASSATQIDLPDTSTIAEPEVTMSEEDILNSMMDGKPLVINNPLTVSGMLVTKVNLQTLFDTTMDKNGHSIDEVFDYLMNSGITNLYEGFNPFQKCS